ncbi:MAG: hypothetical protein M0Q91_17625 [Methanoregula sp.]|jgi:hypothetical protein|nr:hypothetical protein [Methanoregula sp.]
MAKRKAKNKPVPVNTDEPAVSKEPEPEQIPNPNMVVPKSRRVLDLF